MAQAPVAVRVGARGSGGGGKIALGRATVNLGAGATIGSFKLAGGNTSQRVALAQVASSEPPGETRVFPGLHTGRSVQAWPPRDEGAHTGEENR